MPLFINTNISTLYAKRAAQRANAKLDTTFQQLSSGQRINQAKDDAAGIQVADNLTTQLNGLTQGNRNAQDAIAFAQTIEGALDEVTNLFQRIRTLAVQSANGTVTSTERANLQTEVDSLTDEITRISSETTFAGADMLNGAASMVRFQVGADPSSIISIDLRTPMNVNGIAAMAAKNEGLTVTVTNPNGTTTNYTGVIPGYSTANPPVTFDDIFSDRNTNNPGIDLSTPEGAQQVLSGIDALITAVDRKRSQLGAMQNRLEATVRNQDSMKENVTNSRSTILDTDFADATSTLTQQQIIQQATATVLTQSNQRPQIALSLLQG